ncbi:hypothetical protein [uncultured Phascolarctobacterium sp.]|uniref:hypothetical protein n=1 Tax=uncultured Phascolarctobacterium sp. TaxID=512296 RepID=UPI00265CABFB|nr:hypothetical protein [uncultured Phascolarctobacterium sp.]
MSRVNLVFTENGQGHEHAGTVYENTQAVKAAVDFTVEPNGTEGTDTFYKIKGSMSHSIYHADRAFYKPAPNWLSVGYYATQMLLEFTVADDQGDWYAVGPVTSVGSHSESAGGLASVTGSVSSSGVVNFNGSTTFSAADVQIISKNANFAHENRAVWEVQLSHVGFLSPARPINPRPASYGGFSFEFEVGLRTRNAAGAVNIVCKPHVIWLYDYTRGITHHTIEANNWVQDSTGNRSGEFTITLP